MFVCSIDQVAFRSAGPKLGCVYQDLVSQMFDILGVLEVWVLLLLHFYVPWIECGWFKTWQTEYPLKFWPGAVC